MTLSHLKIWAIEESFRRGYSDFEIEIGFKTKVSNNKNVCYISSTIQNDFFCCGLYVLGDFGNFSTNDSKLMVFVEDIYAKYLDTISLPITFTTNSFDYCQKIVDCITRNFPDRIEKTSSWINPNSGRKITQYIFYPSKVRIV